MIPCKVLSSATQPESLVPAILQLDWSGVHIRKCRESRNESSYLISALLCHQQSLDSIFDQFVLLIPYQAIQLISLKNFTLTLLGKRKTVLIQLESSTHLDSTLAHIEMLVAQNSVEVQEHLFIKAQPDFLKSLLGSKDYDHRQIKDQFERANTQFWINLRYNSFEECKFPNESKFTNSILIEQNFLLTMEQMWRVLKRQLFPSPTRTVRPNEYRNYVDPESGQLIVYRIPPQKPPRKSLEKDLDSNVPILNKVSAEILPSKFKRTKSLWSRARGSLKRASINGKLFSSFFQ